MKWDQQTASRLIKKHVKTRGNSPVLLTERLVRYWYTALNIAVFRGKLPSLRSVTFIKHKTAHAWAHPLDGGELKLTIQPGFQTRTLFLSVLVHEMVHEWEHFTGKRMTHGRHFQQWRNLILRKTSLHLETKL